MVIKNKSVNSVKKVHKLVNRREKVVFERSTKKHGSARVRTRNTIKTKFSTKYKLRYLVEILASGKGNSKLGKKEKDNI